MILVYKKGGECLYEDSNVKASFNYDIFIMDVTNHRI